MTNLHCSVKSCINNEKNLCCRQNIKVTGTQSDTCCHSFGHRSDCLISGQAPALPEELTHVRCDATECVYNSSTICSAHDISVEGDGACDCSQTRCATFKTR